MTHSTPSRWRIACRAGLGLVSVTVLVGSLIPGVSAAGPWHSQSLTHFLAYLLLGAMAINAATGRRALWVLVALAGFGVGLELLQMLAPHRQASVVDGLVNVAGVSCGGVVGWVVARYLECTNDNKAG